MEEGIKYWRVKVEGIQPALNKLLYITKEEFKFLRELRKRFLSRNRVLFEKEAKFGERGKKSFNRGDIRGDLCRSNGKIYPCYEGTNIQYTWDSIYWRWRMVREYCKDTEGAYKEKVLMREVRELKNS